MAGNKPGHDKWRDSSEYHLSRSSLRWLGVGRGRSRSSRLLLDHPYRKDRQLVEAHEWHRQRELAQHIRRRQDCGDDEGADDEIAPLLLELLGGDDADAAEQCEDH